MFSPGLPPNQSLFPVLTSVFQKDRSGMREAEGLASEDKAYTELRWLSLG